MSNNNKTTLEGIFSFNEEDMKSFDNAQERLFDQTLRIRSRAHLLTRSRIILSCFLSPSVVYLCKRTFSKRREIIIFIDTLLAVQQHS